jgi:flagellum-specific peptidoglycan hydrolase FlgJ
MSAASFIAQIAPIIQRYAMQYGYKYPSAIIAQACLESAYGTSSLAYRWHNYFGIKWYRGCGRSAVNLSTKEEYTPGVLTSITSGFAVGKDMDDGVAMYFEFLTKNSRYRNLKQATSSRNYLELIKADGYATSSGYVSNTYKVVETYNLTQYDQTEVKQVSYAGIVTASALRVRKSPGGEMVQVGGHDFVLPMNMVVAIDRESCGWGRVAALDAWVSLDYIKR